jgi:diguanylate cyclase (GGDEF)-like protein
MSSNEPAGQPPDAASDLAAIENFLGAGDAAQARERASLALRARRKGDADAARAPLLLGLAWSELALSQPAGAHRAAAEAAELFRTTAESPAQEVLALTAVALTASQCGRAIEAIETATLARHLANDLPPGPWTVLAPHGLAVAYGAAQCFAKARQAHEDAREAAASSASHAARAPLAMAQALTELSRLVVERSDGDAEPDAGRLQAVLTLLSDARPQGDVRYLLPGHGPALAAALPLVTALAQCWCGDAAPLPPVAGPAAQAPAWIPALEAWLMAEIAHRRGEFGPAAAHAQRMVALAGAAEHAPLVRLGHQLACHLLELSGQPQAALHERRLLARRERAQWALDLDGRDAAARRHVQLRTQARHNEALALQSVEFERLAFEDVLTGIANRRRFQQRLAQWSALCAESGETLCAAVIDVDRFKDVNDNFSHQVGDAVLQRIASIMVEHVRAVDLPARFGGDEFVILFRDAAEVVARQVCERIEDGVRRFAWDRLAAGLAVTISVGVVQARPGDTATTLLQRSDEAMFARKRSRRGPEATAPAAPARAVSPMLLQRLASLLGRAEKLVVFVGAGPLDPDAWTPADRERHGHAAARRDDPAGFDRYWQDRAQVLAAAGPSAEHRLLARLAALKPMTTFVTQRVDGLLSAACAGNVIQLGGNVRRGWCTACGTAADLGVDRTCVACGEARLHADIVLPGDTPEPRLAAGAELAVKRADVVLVLDADPLRFPGASLLDKARFRGVSVVLLGPAAAPGGAAANLAIQAPVQGVLEPLLEQLRAGDVRTAQPATQPSSLTDAGFDALCYLSGQGTDHAGRTLEQTLAWSDREIERQFDSTQWQFPLPTRSQICPEAPVPTHDDFRLLGADDAVKAGLRRAFDRMLRFYGFEWHDGRVRKAVNWQARFEVWTLGPGYNDLRLSRIIGALALCGLQQESLALLHALEAHVPPVRRHGTAKAMAFWRHAAGQG